jgi:hypothetical protein
LITPNSVLFGSYQEPGIGTGFNLIARPDFQNQKPFFLEISGTLEDLESQLIGGGIPNCRSEQLDINLHGLRYLQKIC